MATKKATLTVVEQTPVTVVESPAPALDLALEVNDLAALQQQQKVIQERIRELKAAMPERDKLAEVIHKQQSYDTYVPRMFANRVKARVAAGQDREAAAREVIAYFAHLMDQHLDYEEQDEQTARQAEEAEEEETN